MDILLDIAESNSDQFCMMPLEFRDFCIRITHLTIFFRVNDCSSRCSGSVDELFVSISCKHKSLRTKSLSNAMIEMRESLERIQTGNRSFASPIKLFLNYLRFDRSTLGLLYYNRSIPKLGQESESESNRANFKESRIENSNMCPIPEL